MEEKLFPKFILVILDDDLTKLVNLGFGFSDTMGRIIHKLIIEHERVIESHKENLPKRARKPTYPQIIWIQAPLHINFPNIAARVKYNKALETIVKHHDNVHTLQLHKGWDNKEHSLYDYETRRFTSLGLATYWNAVDKTAKYIDTIFLKKQQFKKTALKDRFHWDNRNNSQEDVQRVLPKPP